MSLDRFAIPPPAALVSARRLRQGFERRAAQFSELDFLLQEIGQRMDERLDYIKLAPTSILDLGCGVGGALPALRARFPEAWMMALDSAWGMVQRASAPSSPLKFWQRCLQRLQKPHGGVAGVQADFAQLPFAEASADLIWSNLALHWVAEPHRVLPDWARVLRDDGLLMFSAWGPDTLKELRTAMQQIDGDQHTLRFTDMHDYGDMLIASGLSTPVMDMDRVHLTYQSAERLLKDVRLMGLLPQPSRPGLRGRVWLQQLRAALESQRNTAGELVLTFEMVFGHAWKLPKPKHQVGADGVAVIRLEEISRTRRG